MRKIVIEKTIFGIPDLKIEEGKIYCDCQVGKQTNISHNIVQHFTTTPILELLHMDLMRPMHVKSLGGKYMSLFMMIISLNTPRLNLFVRSMLPLLYLKLFSITYNVKREKKFAI